MVGISNLWPFRSRAALSRDELASADADDLIARFSDDAYDEARQRARNARLHQILDANRPHGHWDRVRRDIARRTGRAMLDTATRYLLR